MPQRDNRRTGGQILIDALRIHGADTVFCVPGESFLAALDAFHDARNDIRLITCRHEGGAANMAEAYGKVRGRPGICFVTRGPGATHACVGVHTAFQDSTPMVLLIGQVGRSMFDREAFQEIDYRAMFGPIAKWVAQVEDPARLPEYVSHAFHVAMSGRKGPVVLALPEDVLSGRGDAIDTEAYRVVQSSPSAAQMDEMRALLAKAERPLAIVGGSGWDARACERLGAFAARNGLPVAASFRCQDRIDNDNPYYAGWLGAGASPALNKRVAESDLLLVIGARLGEMTTQGYSIVKPPVPKQTLIHVYPGAEELGRVYRATLPICAGPAEFLAMAESLEPVDSSARAGWAKDLRAEFEAFGVCPPQHGNVNMGEVMAHLRATLPTDTMIANGAGNYTAWCQRFWHYRHPATQVGPTSGAVGYSVPAAIGAKAARPDRTMACFAGDGCFMMFGQEIATAIQYDLPILIFVINNGTYGTIRMHQEKNYPDRVSGTDLVNPDFAAFARSFGAFGATVTRTEDFPAALEAALASGTTALIELQVDAENITVGTSLTKFREMGYEKVRKEG